MDEPIQIGNIQIPKERTLYFNNNSDLKQKILDGWTSKTPQDWKPDEKVNLKNSRIVISCLLEAGAPDPRLNTSATLLFDVYCKAFT